MIYGKELASLPSWTRAWNGASRTRRSVWPLIAGKVPLRRLVLGPREIVHDHPKLCCGEEPCWCKAVFESAKQSVAEMDSVIYNTALDACVACQDIEAAEEWMGYSKQEGMTDVVSFNTLIKAHLHGELREGP